MMDAAACGTFALSPPFKHSARGCAEPAARGRTHATFRSWSFASTLPVVPAIILASRLVAGQRRCQRGARRAGDARTASLIQRRFSAQETLWLMAGAASGEWQKRKAQLEVSKVMTGHGWPQADPAAYEVEELRGGSNYTETVLSVRSPEPLSAAPERVVYKRYAEDPLRNKRMLAASEAFSNVGAAPPQFVAKQNWLIEEFACEWCSPELDDGNMLFKSGATVARLAAHLHRTPLDWFDAWREEMVLAHPGLRNVPLDSCLWPVVAYTGAANFSSEQIDRLCSLLPAPASASGKRVVSVHGDLHDANVLLMPDGQPVACDFEFSCVSTAVQDLMYKAASVDGNMRRAFSSEYLEASGLQSTEEEAELLAFDACVAAIVHFGIIRRVLCCNKIQTCGLPIMPVQDAIDLLEKLDLASVVERAAADPERRSRIVDHGNVRALIAELPQFALELTRQNLTYA